MSLETTSPTPSRIEVSKRGQPVGHIEIVMDDCVVYDSQGTFVGVYLDEERALRELSKHIEGRS